MRPNRNLLILILFTSLISGCGESKLNKELIELRRDATERRAEIEYYEHQAAIAAACDYIFSMCPESVAATGRQAQKNGFGGGYDWPFWLSVAAKLAAIGTGIGCMISATGAVWVRLGRPAAADIERARRVMKDAEVAQARFESQEQAHQTRLVELRDELKHAAEELERLKGEADAAAQLLQQHQKEIEAVRSAKAALAAFH